MKHCELTRLFFSKPTLLANVVAKISSREQVHYQIEVLSVLKSILHVDNERVVELSKDLSFVHD